MKELGLYDLTPGTLRLREMLDFLRRSDSRDTRDTTLAKNAAKLIDSSGSCAIKYT